MHMSYIAGETTKLIVRVFKWYAVSFWNIHVRQ